LTLDDIYLLALSWVPRRAWWSHLLLGGAEHWGPAHELAHALIEEPWRRRRRTYALCDFNKCTCRGQMCEVHEIAAMAISRRLLSATGNPRLANREYNDTGYGWIIDDSVLNQRALALLKRKGLWPVPRSRSALEAQLRRRFRRSSAPRRPTRPRPRFYTMDSLVGAILGV
jgi:hypothetical protein